MDRAEFQAVQLVLAFALGIALGVFYDVYRVWFRGAHRRAAKGLGDIIWWLLALGLAAGAFYRINSLSLRAAPLALALLGVAVQQGLISPWAFPLLQRFCRAVGRFLGWVTQLLQRLVAFLLLPLVWPVEVAFRLLLAFARLLRRVTSLLGRLLRWLFAPPVRFLRRVGGAAKRRLKRLLAAAPADTAEEAAEET